MIVISFNSFVFVLNVFITVIFLHFLHGLCRLKFVLFPWANCVITYGPKNLGASLETLYVDFIMIVSFTAMSIFAALACF